MEQFLTTIQNMLLEEMTAIPVGRLLVAVAVACIAGVLVAVIYWLTYSGVLFEKQFMLGLILMSMITSIIILAISSNLVLSLGMVGALSIVRFRTAIKEPMDTIFMFWSLAAGILVGAGFFIIAILSTLIVGVLYIAVIRVGRLIKANDPYILVIRYETDAAQALNERLRGLSRMKVRTQRTNEEGCELVVELSLSQKQLKQLDNLRQLPGVSEVNLVSSHGNVAL